MILRQDAFQPGRSWPEDFFWLELNVAQGKPLQFHNLEYDLQKGDSNIDFTNPNVDIRPMGAFIEKYLIEAVNNFQKKPLAKIIFFTEQKQLNMPMVSN